MQLHRQMDSTVLQSRNLTSSPQKSSIQPKLAWVSMYVAMQAFRTATCKACRRQWQCRLQKSFTAPQKQSLAHRKARRGSLAGVTVLKQRMGTRISMIIHSACRLQRKSGDPISQAVVHPSLK